MIFLTSTFFHLFLNLSPRFPDFCHVRKIFTTFLPTTNNAILLTTRVLVLHMFRFPSSSDSATPTTNFEFPQSNYFPAILPTQSTISVQPQIFKLQQLSLPHAIQPANKRSCNDFNNYHRSLIFQSPSTAAQQLPQFLLPRFLQLRLTSDFSASKTTGIENSKYNEIHNRH